MSNFDLKRLSNQHQIVVTVMELQHFQKTVDFNGGVVILTVDIQIDSVLME